MENPVTAPGMTARARRLRVYRFLGNTGWILIALVLLPHVLARVFPGMSDLAVFIWLPAGLLLLVLMLPWLLIVLGFQFGAIKCPSCGAPYATRSTLWIGRSCGNCGFDIDTLRRPGDS